ncbi:MAG: hypothetical protein CL772_06210 [Chloroflexi bacterium]|nr:hypothetical protein [Chloroflexota bacterium]
MRGSIEMNTLKQIASRAMVFVLALAVLVPALIMAGDNNSVQAEKLATVYLTNKGTGFTTEASPPSARSNPASRKNASTVYVTMTDVDTANDVKNSHILNANKVVITVVESDYNKKVSATSGNLAITAAGTANTKTLVIPGKAGDPVIDSDGDGDLSDEVGFVICQDGQVPVFTGSAVSSACAAPEGPTAQIVSVANGDSATSTSATPMITVYITGQGGDSAEDNDDAFVGYYTSAVNTFQVKAWSTVQLESNASDISVVETGRNTGVFEAEFLVADTEGVNDNTAALDAQNGWNATAGNAFGTGGKVPQSLNAAIAAGIANSADGRFDASDGQSADAEWTLIADNLDVGGAIATSGGNTSGTITLPAGSWIADPDGDGSITDSFVLLDDGGGTDIVDANHGTGTTVNTVTCSGTVDTTCTKPTAAARTIVLNITPTAAIANGVSDVADIAAIVSDNVVNNQKFDTNNSDTIDATDLKSGRPGSDTQSGGGGALGLTTPAALGIDRTPIVEAQANATLTVQYQDLTDNSTSTTATTGTKVKATVTVDVSAPTPVVSSPTSGSSFKDRQPSFAGSVTDIGSGIDVSTAVLYVDMLSDAAADGLTSALSTTELTAQRAWLGGAGTITGNDRYDQFAVTLDNSTTMKDGVSSITWKVATTANIPCSTGSADGTAHGALDDTGGDGTNSATNSHTGFVGLISCNAALSTPDVVVDYTLAAIDLAGNRGFSDSKSTDTDTTAIGDPYTINIDEQKPVIQAADTKTGVYWNAATFAEKGNDATKIVVGFNDEIGSVSASSFEVKTDAGVTMTPTLAEIGPKGTDANGKSFDKRKMVYLTLPSSLPTNDTPQVKLVGDVADLAGNSTKSGTVTGAIHKLKPNLTMTLSGGSGTGASGTSNDSDSLTKSAMTITITTDEVLASPPTINVFNENYGKTGAYAQLSASTALTTLGAGNSQNVDIAANTIVDTDKDGSLTDEITLESVNITSTALADLAVTSVTNGGDGNADNVRIVIKNNGSAALPAANDDVKISGNTNAALTSASDEVAVEGTVAAVAQDSKTYTANFTGSAFSDAAADDTKIIYVTANDASTSTNTGTVGKHDSSATGAFSFRLDKTAPVLKNDPDGDGTVGTTTTLPRPYVIFEFTDNSNVTVVSATFGGDDVLAKLATTNNKKYFMVPESDLSSSTYAVKAKGTDLAGNKGAEGSYNLKVTARKDYKATLLAGWNLMSFPSDPVSNGVGSVFTNTGIDQVVGYDAMAKGSPWMVATKDSASGSFSGSLSTIHSGQGYWIHSTEFASQSVSLTGPEGPSASAPPSIPSIELASGWNLIGVVDATKALTQANEGTVYTTNASYLGQCNGSSVTKAYEYDTSNLTWVSIAIDEGVANFTACASNDSTDAQNVNIGEAFWVFATPAASGLLTPIVP